MVQRVERISCVDKQDSLHIRSVKEEVHGVNSCLTGRRYANAHLVGGDCLCNVIFYSGQDCFANDSTEHFANCNWADPGLLVKGINRAAVKAAKSLDTRSSVHRHLAMLARAEHS